MKNLIKINIILIFLCLELFGEEKSEIDTLKTYKIPGITVTSSFSQEANFPTISSSLNFSEIEKKYFFQDMPELLSELPSIYTYSQNGNAIGYSSLAIRGFDQRRISVLINGVPQNDPEDHQVYWIDFPDLAPNLNAIQVQRGAGMTSWGAPAIGGSINLSTKNFMNQREIKFTAGFGFQEFSKEESGILQAITNKFSIEFSSGLIDNYAFYARLSRISSTGYRDRAWTELNSYFLSAFKSGDNWSAQVNVFGGPISDGLAYTGLPKSYINNYELRRKNLSYWNYDSTGYNIEYYSERRKEEVEEFSQPHFELLTDWQINENLNFASTLFYYTGYGYYDFDGSWADTTTLRLTYDYGFKSEKNPINALLKAYVNNKHWGWLPRISVKHQNGTFIFGAELRMHRSEHYGTIPYSEYYPQYYNPDYKFYSYNGKRDILSVFANEIYNLTNNLSLSGELQVVWHRYAISNEKAGNKFTQYTDINGNIIGNGEDLFNINYLFVNPKFGIKYSFDENSALFGSVTYTSREPRMRNLYAAEESYYGATPLFNGRIEEGKQLYDFTNPLVKPEKMFDIELGYYYNSHFLSAGINLYLMEYTDELVKSGRVDLFGNPIDGNAPKTRHYGIEFIANLNIIKGNSGNLQLNANACLSKNTIIEYDFITYNQKLVKLEGNPIAGFPDFLANIRLSYSYDELYVSLLGKFVGESRTDNFGNLLLTDKNLIEYLRRDFYGYYTDNKLDPFFILNFSLEYSIKNILSINNLKLRLQVNNLLNKLYASGGEGKEFFPAAERNIFLGFELGF